MDSNTEGTKTVHLAGGCETSGNFTQSKKANVFVGFATTRGQIATIDKDEGSTYNKALAQTLRDNYQTWHIEEMFKHVIQAVSDEVTHVECNEGGTKIIKEFVQIPELYSTLRRLLYFTSNPKIRVII